jgi:hypothetical protein
MRFLKRLVGAVLLTIFIAVVIRFPLEMINMTSDTIDFTKEELGALSGLPALIMGIGYLFWRRKPHVD